MKTDKKKKIFCILQISLLATMAVIALYLLWQNLLPMYFAAALTLVVAFFVFKKNRWGYFAAATWGLACYQLAKEGFAFDDIKRWVMLGSFVVIIVSLVLHEAYCRLNKKAE